MGFWPLPAHSKLAILVDKHYYLLKRALRDPQTGIQKQGRGVYIIFDEEEALVVQPTDIFVRIGLELVCLFKNL
jgi:hypothetical protein